ncbi:MAG: aspartyl protease family protein, partial [Candidatus Eisenbacteria bacterium]
RRRHAPVRRPRRLRRPAAISFLALLALLALPAGAQPPPPPRVAFEPPAVALARLDSLQGIVRAEESRVRTALGIEANWDRLARAWFQVGDHARAAKCLERARSIGAREFDTALLSGRVARSEGRFAEAVEWLERAARMRPDDWEAHEDLGLALYLAGRLPEAADHWERARALPGSGAPARTGLLETMRLVGDHPYRVSGRGRERLRFVPETARGALVVPVRVNGRGPFLFRIDTGSPEVVLGRSLAQELGLETLAGGEAGAFVGERPVRFDYAALDSLTLGETTLHRLPVAVSDHPGLGGTQGVRGTLGFEALRRFRFCLDLPDSALWVEPPGSPGAAADTARPAWAPPGAVAHRVPVLLRGTHLLVVYGHVNGGPERPFLLDTGGPGIGLAAPTSTLAEAGIGVDTTQAHTGSSAAGPVGYFRFPVARLCVGGACRDSLAGVYGIFPARLELNPNFRLAGLVSNGFLSRYRLGVDLSRREVWLVEP